MMKKMIKSLVTICFFAILFSVSMNVEAVGKIKKKDNIAKVVKIDYSVKKGIGWYANIKVITKKNCELIVYKYGDKKKKNLSYCSLNKKSYFQFRVNKLNEHTVYLYQMRFLDKRGKATSKWSKPKAILVRAAYNIKDLKGKNKNKGFSISFKNVQGVKAYKYYITDRKKHKYKLVGIYKTNKKNVRVESKKKKWEVWGKVVPVIKDNISCSTWNSVNKGSDFWLDSNGNGVIG